MEIASEYYRIYSRSSDKIEKFSRVETFDNKEKLITYYKKWFKETPENAIIVKVTELEEEIDISML